MKPVVGMFFPHRRVIEEDKTPMVYKVTRIAQGWVYYRPATGGHSEKTPVEDFHKVVANAG